LGKRCTSRANAQIDGDPDQLNWRGQKLAGVGVRRASWLRRPTLSPRNPKQNLPSGRQVPTMSQFFHMVPFMKHDAGFGVLTGNGIETRSFRAGDVIFQEGDNALDLFVIKSGQVRIQIGNRTVTELSPDTIFGEMALIDDEPRSATAIAVTDVELVSVSEKQFLFLVGQTPYFALKVMRVLAQRLRQTNKTLS
jgi:CRP/FNR family transcriptional regulator, cyclic AMP receptor protein